MSTVEQNSRAQGIVSDLAKGLGFSVWWQFNSCYITPDELRARVARAGLDDTKVPNIDPDTALKAAVREFRKRKGKRTICQAEVVAEDGAYIKIGLLFHKRVSDDEVAKRQNETLIWDRHARSWADPGLSAYADELRQRISHKQAFYDGNAVRDRVVMPMLSRSCGFSIKKGWYFVPTEFEPNIAEAQQALAGMDSFSLHVASVPGGHGWEQPVAAGVSESLGDELEAIGEQVEGWMEMSRRVRSDTIGTVMGRFENILKRACTMEAALSVSLGDLQDRVKEMQVRANEVIDLKEEELNAGPKQPTVRETLGLLEKVTVLQSYAAIVGEEPPTDYEELLDNLADHMEALNAA